MNHGLVFRHFGTKERLVGPCSITWVRPRPRCCRAARRRPRWSGRSTGICG
ncbi:hypothetical protein I552_8893 [Mycobacterium xenopi 3993]|nr:hypothetical protein I552_8893 [Mycobacterium xenopi 3993]